MTLPTDFPSFAYGFDLTAANYSGGAGGRFTNLVAGGEDWTVNGATPSFSTKSDTGWSLEGVDFTNDGTQAIQGQHRALYESTVLLITQPTAGGYAYGGSRSSSNTFGMNETNKLTVYAAGFVFNSGATPVYPITNPNVLVASWSPANGTVYAQANDGTIASNTAAAGSFSSARTSWPDAGIGQMSTFNYQGWIARVLVFSRALHYRDNVKLQSLILTEMESIGL